jgi:hypothetical protein
VPTAAAAGPHRNEDGANITQLVEKVFSTSWASFSEPEEVQKNFDQKRKTPLLGFFRNYLPSRHPKFQGLSTV